MTKFTIEDLRDIAYRGSYDDLERDLALQLLASMEQEPMEYLTHVVDDGSGEFSDRMNFSLPVGTKLYAAPQLPQPVVAITQHFDTIALDTAKMVMCDVNRRQEFLGGDIQLLSRIQCRIDEACRAAMLQGAEPVSQPYTLRDGWVAVPVEPTEDMVIAGFEAGLREEFRNPEACEAFEAMSGCEQAAHRAKLCWAAMIAAVPQQETKI